MLPPLLNKIASLMKQRPRVDRRVAKRLSPNNLTPCQIRQEGSDTPQSAWIHNLSNSGVGLISTVEVAVGTTIQILIVNAAHTAALSCQVKVVRSTRVVSGHYFLGGEFSNALQHDEMVPFLL